MNNASQQQKSATQPSQLSRVLVVISPDLVRSGAPRESALVSRALMLAKATGCELEFFHVCDDDSLSSGFFKDDQDVRREQAKVVNQEATSMAELVLHLNADGLEVKQDTRWDSPRSDAILRKIRQVQPDLVMKQSREHGYVMGLLGNTDWDLIRQSPAHVWFVADDSVGSVSNIVTAVGASTSDDEILAKADYEVFGVANLLADGFGAKNTPVHAYQVPVGLSTYAAYSPEFGGVAYPPASAAKSVPTAEEARQQIARNHGRSIEAFAEYFHLDPKEVRVIEGRPDDVIASAATELKADLIVMAARNLSRWERWSQSVTAEPVLANAPCDVVFVKDPRDASNPKKGCEPALQGVPVYDLEKAVMDPERSFGSPTTLAHAQELSVPLRRRILQIWKQDIEAQMAEENEGGPIQASAADLLKAISAAQQELGERSQA